MAKIPAKMRLFLIIVIKYGSTLCFVWGLLEMSCWQSPLLSYGIILEKLDLCNQQYWMVSMRICAFGDSFVAGTGDETALGWVGRLALDLSHSDKDATIYNLGVRGDTSIMVQRRWQREWASRTQIEGPKALLFAFGVNDCCDDADGRRRVEIADSLNAAEAIWQEARGLGTVITLGPVPIADERINQRIAELDQRLAEGASNQAIPYLSVFPKLKAAAAWMDAVANWDGAHPNAKGYQALYRLIGPSLLALLRRDT